MIPTSVYALESLNDINCGSVKVETVLDVGRQTISKFVTISLYSPHINDTFNECQIEHTGKSLYCRFKSLKSRTTKWIDFELEETFNLFYYVYIPSFVNKLCVNQNIIEKTSNGWYYGSTINAINNLTVFQYD